METNNCKNCRELQDKKITQICSHCHKKQTGVEGVLKQISVIMTGQEYKLSVDEYNKLYQLVEGILSIGATIERERIERVIAKLYINEDEITGIREVDRYYNLALTDLLNSYKEK